MFNVDGYDLDLGLGLGRGGRTARPGSYKAWRGSWKARRVGAWRRHNNWRGSFNNERRRRRRLLAGWGTGRDDAGDAAAGDVGVGLRMVEVETLLGRAPVLLGTCVMRDGQVSGHIGKGKGGAEVRPRMRHEPIIASGRCGRSSRRGGWRSASNDWPSHDAKGLPARWSERETMLRWMEREGGGQGW